MKTYARTDDNVVVEIILPLLDEDGKEIAIDARFHPDFVAELIEVNDSNVLGKMHVDGEFLDIENSVSIEVKLQNNVAAIQHALDIKAAERGYSSIKSACAYASALVIVGDDAVSIMREKFRLEGNALQEWMGVVWATAYIQQSSILAGDIECPTIDEAVSLMPAFVWPI